MWVAPMQTSLGEHKVQEYHNSMSDWSHFLHETSSQYGVDMSLLTDPYRQEQRKYFLQVFLHFISHFHPFSFQNSFGTSSLVEVIP
jgi:protein arginine N-methyltransferase 1